MAPNVRRLLRVQIEEAIEADTRCRWGMKSSLGRSSLIRMR